MEIPTRFFVTSGKATSKVSQLNAFDEALIKASIGDLNLVNVSSILPVNIKKVRFKEIPRGAIIHCVLARQDGNEGEMIGSGIAYGFRCDGQGGYIAEGHHHGSKKSLREILEFKITEMARLRKIELENIFYKIEELEIKMDHYGTCISAVIFLNEKR
jgi:arginine decarboxylase